MRHADPVAVHAELRVVHRVDDLDLGAVEEVDPAVMHLAHEDFVSPTLQPFLETVDVDHPILLTDELRHELDELELSPSPSEMYSIIRGMCGSVCLNTTMFSLTGLRPTRSASWIPRRTGASSPLRMSRNAAGSSESIETLTRFRPASRRASARFASIDPFVVIETSGSWRTERSMICSMSSRMSGSPPVNFTERIPNSRATRRSRSISATDISSSWGIRGFRIGPRPSSWQ